jgi:hypothetical protein
MAFYVALQEVNSSNDPDSLQMGAFFESNVRPVRHGSGFGPAKKTHKPTAL